MEEVSPDGSEAFRRRWKLAYGGRFIRDITRQLYGDYLRCLRGSMYRGQIYE